MRYVDLPEIPAGLIGMAAYLSVLCGVYLLYRLIRQKRKAIYYAAGSLLVLAAWLNMQCLLSVTSHKLEQMETLGAYIRAIPVWAELLVLLGLAVGEGILAADSRRWERHHITPMSVKESVDALDTGICAYREDGTPKLVNLVMDALCKSITGGYLKDGRAFWEALREGRLQEGAISLQKGDFPIVQLADGRVYAFQRNMSAPPSNRLCEILSADVTEEWQLAGELQDTYRHLGEMNNRLRQLNTDIARTTVEEEILAAKIRIHDELGRIMLASRRYLTERGEDREQGAEIDRGQLDQLWKGLLQLWQTPGETAQTRSVLKDLEDAAGAVGIEISLSGRIPEQDIRFINILTAGARECLTNAYRHAKSTRLWIDISERDGETVLEYRNDGRPPAGEIREGGGLSSLRRFVEGADCVMELETDREFILRIIVLK